MRMWRRVLAGAIVITAASMLTAQIPVLSSVDAPYAALQNSSPIRLAGHSYSAGQVAYGPVGTPLTLSGTNFGQSGTVRFVSYKNGVANLNTVVTATPVPWISNLLQVTVPAGASSGLIFISTANGTSNGLPFIVMPGSYAGSCPAAPPPSLLQIITSALANGTAGSSYSVQLASSGGTGAKVWSIVAGTLPSGIALNAADGTISGTPTTAASAQITVRVVDSGAPQQSDDAVYDLTINPQPSGIPLYNYSIVSASGGKGYDAVGNITAYTDSVNGTWSFNYDNLNRLTSGTATSGWKSGQTMCWSYDAFGNRLSESSEDKGCADQTYSSFVYGDNNRVSGVIAPGIPPGGSSNVPSPSPLTYDAAGNVTLDLMASEQYLYDAEGRVCAVVNTAATGQPTMIEYLYNAEGTRVAKGTISNWSCDTTIDTSTGLPKNGFQATTVYVLGPGGEQLSELTKSGSAWQWVHTNVYTAGQQIATYSALGGGALYFHLSDWLGTRRQTTDYAGNPCTTFTGLPYGQMPLPQDSTPCLAPIVDPTEHHFTGKERDTESGNDYFGARYYASSMGRWLSPDKADGHITNPQSWNRYIYSLNTPLRFIDPDGNDPIDPNLRYNIFHFDDAVSSRVPLLYQAYLSGRRDGMSPSLQGAFEMLSAHSGPYDDTAGHSIGFHVFGEVEDLVSSEISSGLREYVNSSHTTDLELGSLLSDVTTSLNAANDANGNLDKLLGLLGLIHPAVGVAATGASFRGDSQGTQVLKSAQSLVQSAIARRVQQQQEQKRKAESKKKPKSKRKPAPTQQQM